MWHGISYSGIKWWAHGELVTGESSGPLCPLSLARSIGVLGARIWPPLSPSLHPIIHISLPSAVPFLDLILPPRPLCSLALSQSHPPLCSCDVGTGHRNRASKQAEAEFRQREEEGGRKAVDQSEAPPPQRIGQTRRHEVTAAAARSLTSPPSVPQSTQSLTHSLTSTSASNRSGR